MLADAGPAGARRRRAARVHVGRRGAARARSASAGPTHFGCEILDGIGSTEMLHIFLSNRPGDVRYGTTGRPVPGYELRCVGDDGARVAATARSASCRSAGPSAALMYWNNREKTQRDLPGRVDAQRRQVHARRRRLLHLRRPQRRHAEGRAASTSRRSRSRPRSSRTPAVLEAAVIGDADERRADQAQGLRRAEARPAPSTRSPTSCRRS